MDKFFYQLALLGYGIAMVGFFIYLLRPQHSVSRAATLVLLSGFFFHSIGFTISWIDLGYFPFITVKSSLSFVAWFLVIVYLMFGWRLAILGTFLSPLIVGLMLLSRVVPSIAEPRPPIKVLWLSLHIGFSLIGDALLALAFCVGIMYLVQERHIKTKKLGGLYQRLPSLTLLDDINHKALIWGFSMLTLGLILGAIYAQWVRGHYFTWDPKEVWSVITWLVYAILIHERLAVGWRGRRAAIISIIGFMFLLFTFFGVNYLLKSYHVFK
ncbi:MAG: c-type cytochrome biogenesis protein CcsB [Deltaproteobacteria bacterium]|nr:MAG: c-type cytochrome biogenesis protein CcsB [Deltaproteobacteria bacterium]